MSERVSSPLERVQPPQEAGYVLDLRVLTEVMGKRMHEEKHKDGATWYYAVRDAHEPNRGGGYVRPDSALDVAGCLYSRDDAAAMRVVDALVGRGYCASITLSFSRVWCAQIWLDDPGDHREGIAWNKDRRIAICHAALKAVEKREG